ncbi:PucR family transcriptional regulator [Planotetraspora sp. GP83]|uniref:PucR family transcriptional regulator n=1 Tax=Planotetraspora sp. GP83 TaxID=3156264 RepID=UPI00351800E2
MAPTLRRVVAIVPLHLDVLAGREALDRPVRWVAVSELEDPTPFLEGGELVLTTGMRLTSEEAPPYVSRLVARGVAGLGLGVGLSHDVVPPALVEAAASAGLPLVEVHRDTPFIAIGKAVSELLAAEQYEEISRAFAAQGRLTRAALQPAGTGAVIERLAREIHGWALLFDDAGAVRQAADAAAAPEAAARSSDAGVAAGAGGASGGAGHWAEVKAKSLQPELARLRRTPSLASLALSTPGEQVIVQPLGRRGFFAVGSERAFSPIGHTVVNAAGSLLTLALEQGRDQRTAATRVRAAVLRLLLAGETKAAVDTMAAMGGTLPDGPVTVLACEMADADSLAEALPCFTAPWEGRGTEMVVALVPAERTDEITARAAEHGRVGVSAPGVDLTTAPHVPAGPRLPSAAEPPAVPGRAAVPGAATALDLATALDQAERALASANPVARFAEMAGRGLLSLIDPAAAASFAAALLAPLREYGSRADLVESLRAYLASNGHWDAAAQRLGVHRHTLRYRMKRVSELLGRDLDDPAVRAELWIALCH